MIYPDLPEGKYEVTAVPILLTRWSLLKIDLPSMAADEQIKRLRIYSIVVLLKIKYSSDRGLYHFLVPWFEKGFQDVFFFVRVDAHRDEHTNGRQHTHKESV